MEFSSFSCISVVKGPGPLQQVHKLAVIQVACIMFTDKRQHQAFQTASCQGRVRTEWKAYQIGAHFGTVFKADIETERGDYEFTFLLSEEDLLAGVESFSKPDDENTYYIARGGYFQDEQAQRDMLLAGMMASSTKPN